MGDHEERASDHRNIYVYIHTDSGMILYVALAFVLTLMLVPGISQFMKRHSITGEDVHKSLKPEIPEMGGLSYVFSLSVVLFMAFILLHSPLYVGALSVLLLTALIGAYDDLRGLNQSHKVLYTCIAGIPLLFFVEDTTIDFFVVSLDFSWAYYFLVLMGVAACSNATNILAGFNGEEAGLGAIAAGSLGMCSIILGREEPQLLLFSLCASLLAFLIFNKFPAFIFPGDIGTLPIGGLIAASVVLGKMELLGVIALLPAIIEFFLKMGVWFKGKEYGPTQVVKGRLIPPPYLSVANFFTKRFNLTEKILVYMLWTLGGVCGLIVIFLSFVMI
jgi:UDP-N-acetylglucosamine--dolichyl-phosphate N-acetylglucosaminephosphotransferase